METQNDGEENLDMIYSRDNMTKLGMISGISKLDFLFRYCHRSSQEDVQKWLISILGLEYGMSIFLRHVVKVSKERPKGCLMRLIFASLFIKQTMS